MFCFQLFTLYGHLSYASEQETGAAEMNQMARQEGRVCSSFHLLVGDHFWPVRCHLGEDTAEGGGKRSEGGRRLRAGGELGEEGWAC